MKKKRIEEKYKPSNFGERNITGDCCILYAAGYISVYRGKVYNLYSNL